MNPEDLSLFLTDQLLSPNSVLLLSQNVNVALFFCQHTLLTHLKTENVAFIVLYYLKIRTSPATLVLF